MNQLAKYKIYLAAACAAAVSALGVLGYTSAAQCVAAISSALLAALGMNAIGLGMSATGNNAGSQQAMTSGGAK